MYSYVYRITDLNPSDDRKYYVGKHFNKSDNIELGVTYFTSSKIVSYLWKKYKNRFIYKIIKIFYDDLEAIKFESKYHKRLNVQNNKNFYNVQNQTNTAHYERSNKVYIKDIINKISYTIDCDVFYANKNIYQTPHKNKILAISPQNNSKTILVDKDIFYKNHMKGVNYNKLYVKNLLTGDKETISKDTYQKNKNKYYHILQKISVYDVKNKCYTIIDKNLFDGERYVVVNKNRTFKKVQCFICKKLISNTNIQRHIDTHLHKQVYISNYYVTLKCNEYTFYLLYKNFNYFVCNKFGYINNICYNLRYLSKLIIKWGMKNEY